MFQEHPNEWGSLWNKREQGAKGEEGVCGRALSLGRKSARWKAGAGKPCFFGPKRKARSRLIIKEIGRDDNTEFERGEAFIGLKIPICTIDVRFRFSFFLNNEGYEQIV